MAFGSISIASAVILFQIALAELVVKPTDTEALVGYPTFFNCSTSVVSQEAQWFHHSFVVKGDRSLVYGYNQFYDPYKERFAIEKNEATGTFNLVIKSVQVLDAGRFECQEDVGRGDKASARLIVLDQNPVCQSNQKTNEVVGPNTCGIPMGEIQLTCSATYHGDDAPLLRWFKDGSDQPLAGSTNVSPSGNRSISNLTLKADSIKNGSSFHCRTTRSKPTSYNCTSDSYKIIGINMTCPLCPLCPVCPDMTAAFLVIFLLLIPLIIAASVFGGTYIQWRQRWPWPIKIFNRLAKRDDAGTSVQVVKSRDEDAHLNPEDGQLLEKKRQIEENNARKDEELAGLKQKCKNLENAILKLEDEKRKLEDTKRKWEVEKRKLEGEKCELEVGKRNLEDENRKLKDEKRNLEDENRKLEVEKRKLEGEKNELEGWLYAPAITTYNDNPKAVITIDIEDMKTDSKKKKKPIFGMTILSDKLYVVTENSYIIDVYDSVTFNRETKWEIAGMSNPMDISSCSRNNCLYICDSKSKNELTILRVDSSQMLLKSWSIEEEKGYLSVSREGNVIVSLFNGNKIIEYSPEGDVIRTVRLSPADNIFHPWHAIKTTSMHFIFSHGIGNDPLQRVCVVSDDGRILKSFGTQKGKDIDKQHMNRPVHLLEDGSRNLLVADMKNKRVVLLSPTLEFKRILVSADTSKFRFPMRLCLDEKRGILFVADNNYTEEKVGTYDSGRILIFNCKT